MYIYQYYTYAHYINRTIHASIIHVTACVTGGSCSRYYNILWHHAICNIVSPCPMRPQPYPVAVGVGGWISSIVSPTA